MAGLIDWEPLMMKEARFQVNHAFLFHLYKDFKDENHLAHDSSSSPVELMRSLTYT